METLAFALAFWCGVPSEFASRERYQEIADAGFTVAHISGGSEEVRRALDWCAEVGITGMVEDGRMPRPRRMDEADWRDKMRAVVADYHDHSALWGYFITDEPSADEFRALADIVAELRRLDPDHPAYINLYPNYAEPWRLGAERYADYVTQFIETVQPSLVCYDHYALLEDDVTRPVYFPNLATVRGKCVEAGLDFWQVILATPFGSYRNPTDADLRWQVWTTLAYGAKGVSYYTYWTPMWKNYHDAVIDEFGERTHHYPLVQRINRQVVQLGPTLAGLRSVGVVHGSGQAGATEDYEPRFMGKRPDQPIIVGEFEGTDGQVAVIVVNCDLRRSTYASLTFKPEFRSMRIVSRRTGRVGREDALEETGRGPQGNIWLSPGDGALLLLERNVGQ